ncbi:MAG: class I SAM-dependent methyltransferase [Solirubrobacteraceae bacterium]
MVVTPEHGLDTAPAVIWHDLECGGYRADLPLWRELAEDARLSDPAAQILDVGAGAGRVSLDLARAGHSVTALDRDQELLAALRERAAGMPVESVHADARSFELERRDYALCVMPMQTIQLLGGSDARLDFLRQARAHLRPGGLLACAIVTELEPFDSEIEGHSPSPEMGQVGEALFASRALSVRLNRHTIRIERERIITAQARATRELNVIELDRVSASRLHREGRAAGLTDVGTRTVAATDEHVGSVVVMLSA